MASISRRNSSLRPSCASRVAPPVGEPHADIHHVHGQADRLHIAAALKQAGGLDMKARADRASTGRRASRRFDAPHQNQAAPATAGGGDREWLQHGRASIHRLQSMRAVQ